MGMCSLLLAGERSRKAQLQVPRTEGGTGQSAHCIRRNKQHSTNVPYVPWLKRGQKERKGIHRDPFVLKHQVHCRQVALLGINDHCHVSEQQLLHRFHPIKQQGFQAHQEDALVLQRRIHLSRRAEE